MRNFLVLCLQCNFSIARWTSLLMFTLLPRSTLSCYELFQENSNWNSICRLLLSIFNPSVIAVEVEVHWNLFNYLLSHHITLFKCDSLIALLLFAEWWDELAKSFHIIGSIRKLWSWRDRRMMMGMNDCWKKASQESKITPFVCLLHFSFLFKFYQIIKLSVEWAHSCEIFISLYKFFFFLFAETSPFTLPLRYCSSRRNSNSSNTLSCYEDKRKLFSMNDSLLGNHKSLWTCSAAAAADADVIVCAASSRPRLP